MTFRHCDERILHAPGECHYCDLYPGEQQLRLEMCVAFSGHVPTDGQRQCPADLAVEQGERGDYNKWPRNRRWEPESVTDPLADVIQKANLEWVDGHLPRHKFVTAAVKAHIAEILDAEEEECRRVHDTPGFNAVYSIRASLLGPTEELDG